ncbi:DUF4870 domain-containing protein [uncultured Psychroserpens sp.]|uniref:DUF4870 domain-containing protein n=1 Tax=uncultured Psychroserpens sp. TaxID=255436 RepID=UPI00262A7E8E|nr:DUF4870 domain-containing protein [uncultured Psychroserpens sp.]
MQLINSFIISFIGIPFGNLIFTFILWYRNRKSKFVDEVGRRIINFQILWWIALNVIIVCITAIKLKHNSYNFLNLPIRFL